MLIVTWTAPADNRENPERIPLQRQGFTLAEVQGLPGFRESRPDLTSEVTTRKGSEMILEAKRKWLVAIASAALAAGVCAGIALAVSGGSGSGYTAVGPFVNPDQADVTTCPPFPIWARGRFSNTYKVFPRRPDGTYLVVGNGLARYSTLAGQSVGACNNGAPDNGNTVDAGVQVRAKFTSAWVIHNGTFDPNATCQSVNPSCLIHRFTPSYFGPSAWFESVSEIGIYESRCNGSWLGTGLNISAQMAGDITGVRKASCDS